MEVKTGRLEYNLETNRYGILYGDLWINDGLHCGETLEVLINNKWVKDKIEMTNDEKYYLINSNLIDTQLEGIEIKIK